MQKLIPKQLRNDCKTIILTSNRVFAKIFKISSLPCDLIENFYIWQLFLESDSCLILQSDLGTLNVMQLMLNMPLVSVNFPANTLIFYKAMIDLANLNILPYDTINQRIFRFNSDDSDDSFSQLSLPLNFQMIDIFETS